MAFPKNEIYLASRSIRRRELLKQIKVKHNILLMREALNRPVDIDETYLPNESPTDYVYRVAHTKAEQGWRRVMHRNLPVLPVLAADTVATIDGSIFGKPKNLAHAEDILTTLSGNTHQVLTAIALTVHEKTQVRISTTTVRFREISKLEIHAYLANNETYDVAGAYAIQGIAATFIVEIKGSYSGVVGLPLFETAQLLEESGITIFT